MTAYLLTVGDEILIGQIIDSNSAWMAQRLNLQGARIAGKASVADVHSEIVEAVGYALTKADVVLMTGGLGATKDDITKKALAEFFKVNMIWSQETYDRMEYFFKKIGRGVSPLNRESCFMPENATLLKNDAGLAPGMWFEQNGKVVISMPGVPSEMQHLMEARVLPKLKERFPASPIVHRTILTVGEGETMIAEKLTDFENSLPAGLKLAYLPHFGQVRLRLTGTGPDEAALQQLVEKKAAELDKLVRPIVYGYEEETLASAIGKLLLARGMRLALAESCTGGFLASQITANPGCSAYFLGGVVAYDNQVKIDQLSVRPETLQQFGAVSEETALEMARGALASLKADVAVAVTGIAGPDGGTPEKPVGTVWLAIAAKDYVKAMKLTLDRGRARNIEWASVNALNLVRKFLTGAL